LPEYASELCIFVNTPLQLSASSSTAELRTASEDLGPRVMTELLSQFEIKDYSLF